MEPGAGEEGWKNHEKMQQHGVCGRYLTHQNTTFPLKKKPRKTQQTPTTQNKNNSTTKLSLLQIFRFVYDQNLPQAHGEFLTEFRQALSLSLLFSVTTYNYPKTSHKAWP